MRKNISATLRTLLFFLAAGMFLFSCDEKIDPSSEASITSLTLTVDGVDYAVTFTGKQALLRLGPLGTPVPATVGVKEIALSDGATSVARGTQLTVTDNAVTITVKAADGKTTNTYTVSLGFTTAGITSFTFEVTDNENMALDTTDRKRIVGTIDQEDGTIAFDEQSAYVYLDKLKATFEVSEPGATVQVGGSDQESGVTEQDFSSPVSYVVRAADGTETTYTVTLTKSTLATIPDAQFRAKLKEFFPTAFTEDQLNITHDDVVNSSGTLNVGIQTPKLTSVKGVEFFTSLTYLYCFSNSLTSLDVSKNTALTYLHCSNNSIPSLDVRANTSLLNLNCSNNSIPSLDVRANTALTFLNCQKNSLESLDVRANTALTSLNCNGNRLTSLDVSANTALTGLDCSENSIPSLDVSANTALIGLNCGTNSISSLDVSANTALTDLSCNENRLTSLDVRANTALTGLDCSENSLPFLDVSANTALTSLSCNENSLDSLDVSKNTSLTALYCRENSLTFLDMTGMRTVTGLDIGTGRGTDNPLATLRVNTAVQDADAIVIMNGGAADLTVTTVNNEGAEVCKDYTPATGGGRCNDN